MTEKATQVLLELRTDSRKRYNSLVEAKIYSTDLSRVFSESGQSRFSLSKRGLEVSVPFQLDAADDHLELSFLIDGEVPTNTQLSYELTVGKNMSRTDLLNVTEKFNYQGQDSFEIRTPSATYVYHKHGAGFASIVDREGYDWLSYRPFGGSDGKYRGIPNLVYPEGYFHPGGTACWSRLTRQGPLKVELLSGSKDGAWACSWEIFPDFARLNVLKAPKAFWFLYEGTPGGKLDEGGDFCVRSSGERTAAAEAWETSLPEPRWVYFGASGAARVLYLLHHGSAQGVDSYWPMETNMTVFGFGRADLESYLTETPAQFTVGFAESQDAEPIQTFLEGLRRPLSCSATLL